MDIRNPLLYGRDPEERIVGVHLVGDDQVMIYTRGTDDLVTSRTERFQPFCYLTDRALEAAQAAYIDFDAHPLKGDPEPSGDETRRGGSGPFTTLAVFDSWRRHWDVVKTLREDDRMSNEFYVIYSPVQQYLMQSGKTLYKGMTMDDVYRLQLDIETYSSTGAFPSADRPADRIVIVSLSDNRGWSKVLRLANQKATGGYPFEEEVFEDETELLRGLVREIHRRNPDVIELHNGFGFDLDYITARCEMHGLMFSIGRDRKPPKRRQAQKKAAERDFNYTNHTVNGRAVIDTMFLAAAYDVFARDLPGLGLKAVADYFRKKDGATYAEMYGRERTYVQGEGISRLWDENPDELLLYAVDDVLETRYLADKLAAATFYLTQMTPLTYQENHLAGSGKIIESIMVRQYLTKMQAMSQPQYGKQSWGGYTDMFYTGRVTDIVYADVESLYPSIMMKYECHPRSDRLGVHKSMLEQLKALRLTVKKQANEARDAGDNAREAALRATEQAFKIIINSGYGVMGDSFSLFNDFEEADRVARTGQSLLKRMMYLIEQAGGTIIECDTDGVMFVAPPELRGDLDGQIALVKRISAQMPEGINVDMDGLYEVMISYRSKNYALREYPKDGKPGKIKTKGGAFKNRGIEQFGRDYAAEVLLALMNDDPAEVHRIHERYKARILRREMTVAEIETKKTLKESMATYDEKREAGASRQAQYDLARRFAERTGRPPLKGDTIRYYIAGDKKAYKVTGFVDGRLSEDYTPGDENVHWYLDRLKLMAGRFRVFFAPQDFERVFSNTVTDPNQADLFGSLAAPDFSGTKIATIKVKDTPSIHPF